MSSTITQMYVHVPYPKSSQQDTGNNKAIAKVISSIKDAQKNHDWLISKRIYTEAMENSIVTSKICHVYLRTLIGQLDENNYNYIHQEGQYVLSCALWYNCTDGCLSRTFTTIENRINQILFR